VKKHYPSIKGMLERCEPIELKKKVFRKPEHHELLFGFRRVTCVTAISRSCGMEGAEWFAEALYLTSDPVPTGEPVLPASELKLAIYRIMLPDGNTLMYGDLGEYLSNLTGIRVFSCGSSTCS
jgi:hypothetical protein